MYIYMNMYIQYIYWLNFYLFFVVYPYWIQLYKILLYIFIFIKYVYTICDVGVYTYVPTRLCARPLQIGRYAQWNVSRSELAHCLQQLLCALLHFPYAISLIRRLLTQWNILLYLEGEILVFVHNETNTLTHTHTHIYIYIYTLARAISTQLQQESESVRERNFPDCRKEKATKNLINSLTKL